MHTRRYLSQTKSLLDSVQLREEGKIRVERARHDAIVAEYWLLFGLKT